MAIAAPRPILKGDHVELADAAGAKVTPEIFIKDKNGKVVFHDPPDNRLNPTATPTVFYLKDALEALTAGKPVPVAFAIWNGEQGDRNGRKMVSNWYQLILERRQRQDRTTLIENPKSE